jgi:hypothetical protein
LTRRAAAGSRREALALAAIVVARVALAYVGRPRGEVMVKLRAEVADAGLALTGESLRAVADSISAGDPWVDPSD